MREEGGKKVREGGEKGMGRGKSEKREPNWRGKIEKGERRDEKRKGK